MSAVRSAFERALIDTGAGQLIFGESSDGAGAVRFQRVPEGAWMLLAWRETPHAKRPPLRSGAGPSATRRAHRSSARRPWSIGGGLSP